MIKIPSSARMLIALVIAGVSSQANAHTRLVSPEPRSDSTGLTEDPCGGEPRSDDPTVLVSGSVVEITWEEVIQHPGWFRIAFSPANDQGFDENVLADMIENPDGTGCYSLEVVLPDVICSDCTVQLQQVATNEVDAEGNYVHYNSCADIVLEPMKGTSKSTQGKPSLYAVPEQTCSGGCSHLPHSVPMVSIGGLVALFAFLRLALKRALRS